jgi:hypothetical protein
MIRKSGFRFSEKIMLEQQGKAIADSTQNYFALERNRFKPNRLPL